MTNYLAFNFKIISPIFYIMELGSYLFYIYYLLRPLIY